MTGAPQPAGEPDPTSAKPSRAVFGWIALLSTFLLGGLAGAALWCAGPTLRADWLSQHGPAVIGVPAALLVATALVCGIRAIDGEIRTIMPGVEAKGGSAMLLWWLTVFVAMVFAIRVLW